jgi:hypothetical protein
MSSSDNREDEKGMTVNQLIDALIVFRQRFGGDLHVITTDYDTIGDIDMYDGLCFLGYKDLQKFKLRPYMFEFFDDRLDG